MSPVRSRVLSAFLPRQGSWVAGQSSYLKTSFHSQLTEALTFTVFARRHVWLFRPFVLNELAFVAGGLSLILEHYGHLVH